VGERQCPICGSTNTSAVVNDVQWHTKWVTQSSARQERHILAGCGCRDCKATWEQWDAPAGHGEPFNVKTRCECGGTMTSRGFAEFFIDAESRGEHYERCQVFVCDTCGLVDYRHVENFFTPDTSHDEYRDRP
jgi:hypothetical protein